MSDGSCSGSLYFFLNRDCRLFLSFSWAKGSTSSNRSSQLCYFARLAPTAGHRLEHTGCGDEAVSQPFWLSAVGRLNDYSPIGPGSPGHVPEYPPLDPTSSSSASLPAGPGQATNLGSQLSTELFQLLMGPDVPGGIAGPSNAVPTERSGILWDYLILSGIVSGILWKCLSGIFWNFLELSGIFWNFLELFRIIWNYLELSGIIWNFLELSGICLELSAIFRNFLELSGIFWNYLELSGYLKMFIPRHHATVHGRQTRTSRVLDSLNEAYRRLTRPDQARWGRWVRNGCHQPWSEC